jgi:hypothetical protein
VDCESEQDQGDSPKDSDYDGVNGLAVRERTDERNHEGCERYKQQCNALGHTATIAENQRSSA